LIQKRIRNSDCLARWGGEEFMLLLPHTSLTSATALAETLLLGLREAEVSGIGSVSASFGVTMVQPGDTVQRLEQRADTLMYAAKQAGRNCVRSG